MPEVLRDQPVDASVSATEIVFRGRVWDVRRDTVPYGDGEIVREYVAHPGAVAIVALDEQERILLTQQYRHPIRHRDWEIPAGLLDVPGEELLHAAQRELAEEADLVAGSWLPLLSIFTSPGGNDEVVHIFLARDLRPAPTAHDREEEEADIRVEWLPIDSAVNAIMTGDMANSILVAAVFAAREVIRGDSGPCG